VGAPTSFCSVLYEGPALLKSRHELPELIAESGRRSLKPALLLHRDVVLDPAAQANWLSALALVTVYLTTVLSWIDWHVTMEARPYNFNPRNQHRVMEQTRLGLDVLVVIAYAYLLFTIEEFKKVPDRGVGGYLLGFPVVFGAYLLSGLTRRQSHGRLASNPTPILVFGVTYLALWGGHRWIYVQFSVDPELGGRWVDAIAIAMTLVLMLGYRATRRVLAKRRRQTKDAGLVVGIDVDGVLANQINGIVPRVKARLGISLRYEDVTEWRLPLGSSDIAKEIAIALEDQEYVIGMPVHDGARDLVDELYKEDRVLMITARPADTRVWTSQWLQNHGFMLDELVSVKEEKKSLYRSDVLIDDYIGNIHEYLENTSGIAILVDQPWNRRERGHLRDWISQDRLHVVTNMREVLPIIRKLRRDRVGNRRGPYWQDLKAKVRSSFRLGLRRGTSQVPSKGRQQSDREDSRS
jgi:5'(3')-deoxyribonucleotidase